MKRSYPRPVGLAATMALLYLVLSGLGCGAIDAVITNEISTPIEEVAARDGAEAMGPHMLMTVQREERPGDRERARELADALKAGAERFRDVEDAVAVGYESFPPEPPADLQEIHYVHRKWSAAEAEEIDPERPGSLLYRRTDDGGLRLVGAMVTAAPTASLEELDRRVPLSMTRWHLHTNINVPRPIWDEEQWARTTDDGEPLFGPDSPIATREESEAVGGRFLPVVFGWMAHAYVFDESLPEDAPITTIWEMPGHGDGHHGH